MGMSTLKLAMAGQLGGAAALVLLVTAPFSGAIATWKYGLAQAVVAVLLIAFYFATNWAHFGQFASRRSTGYFLISVATGAFLLAALVGINFIAYQRNHRWDVSRNQVFTLAKQTKDALAGLKDPVRAIAFIPSNASGAKDRVERLLGRYQREAPEKFSFRVIDPNRAPDLVREYQLTPQQPVVVLARGEGERAQHIPLPLLNSLSEQELTNALVELGDTAKRKVYFLEGHGEWPLSPPPGTPPDKALAMAGLQTALRAEGYRAEPLNLAGKANVPSDAAALVISGARSRLSDTELGSIARYVDEGGRLIFGSEPDVDEGLGPLLEKYGVMLDPGMLADMEFSFESIYFVVSVPEFFGEHPIMTPLKQAKLNLRFPTARGVTVLRQPGFEDARPTVLAMTSPSAWEETKPDQNPQPSDGEKAGQIGLAAVSSRVVPSEAGQRLETRIVVLGDSETLTDAMLTFEGNRNFVLNCFAWLTDQSFKITIRPPDRDLSTIDLTPENVAQIRFFGVALLPITLLCIAVGVWIQRRNK